MAAWDNVSLPSAPAAPSYAAPLLNFAPIGDYGKDYFEGTQMARTRALQTAFKDGLPKNPDGSIDIKSATDTLAKLGGADAAMPLLNLSIQQQIGQGNADVINGGGGTGATQPVPAARPQSQPVPPHGIPLTAGSGASPVAQDNMTVAPVSGGAPSHGGNTLMDMISNAGVPDEKAGFVAATISKRLGIDANASITDPAMKANIGRQLMAAGAGTPTPTQYGNPTVPTQDTGPASPTPPGMDIATADRLDAAAQRISARAAQVGKFDPQGAIALTKQAEILANRSKQIRDLAAKNAETTPEQKNATAAGTPNPLDYEQKKEWNKADVTHYEKQLGAIQGSGQAADRLLQHIQLAEGIYKNPDFQSGTGEGLILAYKKAVNLLNPNNTEPLPQEAFRKTMAASILNQVEQLKDDTAAAGGSSRIFQAQIELMEKAANNPDNSLPANRLLTEISKRAALASKAIAGMANTYKSGHLDSAFAQKVSDYYTQNPMFSPQEMNDIRMIAPPVAPKLDTQAQAVQWARKAGLKTGDPIKLPSGRVVPAP